MSETLLVDLDGTITDPAPGIIGSFIHALETLGIAPPPAAELHWVIGPPLRHSFAEFGLAEADREAALAAYRARYKAGAMFEATLYDGIAEALAAARAAGTRLILTTSKAHVLARPILAHFGLEGLFHAVHGSELDGRNDDKGDLIAHILAEEAVEPSRAIMIGDRKYDVIGARRHAIPTLGALWGYGGEAELREAGAAALCAAPAGMAEALAALRRNR